MEEARPKLQKRRSLTRLIGLVLLSLIALDALWFAINWPDWKELEHDIPKSRFMKQYDGESIQWTPVSLSSIPKHVVRAFIIAEDSRFYSHHGFDWDAIREAFDYNLERKSLSRGASTISQQTVKNLFLSRSRSPVRKWHELVLTWAMERNLSKQRILALYLNVAEFGDGVFGVQAAARRYWKTSASNLSLIQAAELAASLPSPKRSNPATRTRSFLRRRQIILRRLIAVNAAPKVVEAKPVETPEREPDDTVALDSALKEHAADPDLNKDEPPTDDDESPP